MFCDWTQLVYTVDCMYVWRTIPGRVAVADVPFSVILCLRAYAGCKTKRNTPFTVRKLQINPSLSRYHITFPIHIFQGPSLSHIIRWSTLPQSSLLSKNRKPRYRENNASRFAFVLPQLLFLPPFRRSGGDPLTFFFPESRQLPSSLLEILRIDHVPCYQPQLTAHRTHTNRGKTSSPTPGSTRHQVPTNAA